MMHAKSWVYSSLSHNLAVHTKSIWTSPFQEYLDQSIQSLSGPVHYSKGLSGPANIKSLAGHLHIKSPSVYLFTKIPAGLWVVLSVWQVRQFHLPWNQMINQLFFSLDIPEFYILNTWTDILYVLYSNNESIRDMSQKKNIDMFQ